MEFEKAAKKHNQEYIKNTDWRIKKPLVIFHKENSEKKLVLSNNWVLISDKLETMLDKPNDVAIYSNISMSSLKQAKVFHQDEIITRQKIGFPSKVLQQKDLKRYYDYFETIITSVVFAYTAIEAFANICIPNSYVYSCLDKEGCMKNMKKEEIEKHFSLTDKLKYILPEILTCDKPTTKSLVWQRFIELEKLRNEIIHSKESKSEDRYSSLLSSSLFQIIENHKEIIKFFGEAIHTKKKELLDEYPNGFGFDSYRINKVSDEVFKKNRDIL